MTATPEGTELSHECGNACTHVSDCALHNAPALPVSPCSCGGRVRGGHALGCERVFGVQWVCAPGCPVSPPGVSP